MGKDSTTCDYRSNSVTKRRLSQPPSTYEARSWHPACLVQNININFVFDSNYFKLVSTVFFLGGSKKNDIKYSLDAFQNLIRLSSPSICGLNGESRTVLFVTGVSERKKIRLGYVVFSNFSSMDGEGGELETWEYHTHIHQKNIPVVARYVNDGARSRFYAQ